MKANAQTLHESLILVDGHCDSVLDLMGLSFRSPDGPPRDLLERGDGGHVDLPRLIEGGVTAQFFALFTDDALVKTAREHTWRMLEAMEGLLARTDGLRLARSARDVEDAKASGRVAAFLTIEGGEAIGESLDELRAFYTRGVRLMGLTWNRRNALGSGAAAKDGGGLTDFGRRVVAEMEDLGMIVDASHLSDKALDDLLETAERPVVASHSNSREVRKHRRNLTDGQAERIAASGGLVAVTFAGAFVDEVPAKVSLSRLLDHVDRLVAVVGTEHVGLGTDFDGYSDEHGTVMQDCSQLPRLTEALLERGYAPSDVRSIMGGNWLRVIRDVMG